MSTWCIGGLNIFTIFSFALYGDFATISQLADPMAAKAVKDEDKGEKNGNEI